MQITEFKERAEEVLGKLPILKGKIEEFQNAKGKRIWTVKEAKNRLREFDTLYFAPLIALQKNLNKEIIILLDSPNLDSDFSEAIKVYKLKTIKIGYHFIFEEFDKIQKDLNSRLDLGPLTYF